MISIFSRSLVTKTTKCKLTAGQIQPSPPSIFCCTIRKHRTEIFLMGRLHHFICIMYQKKGSETTVRHVKKGRSGGEKHLVTNPRADQARILLQQIDRILPSRMRYPYANLITATSSTLCKSSCRCSVKDNVSNYLVAIRRKYRKIATNSKLGADLVQQASIKKYTTKRHLLVRRLLSCDPGGKKMRTKKPTQRLGPSRTNQ